MNKLKLLLLLSVPILSLGIILSNSVKLFDSEKEKPSSKKEQISNSYGNIPMSFEENRGQVDSKVKFLSRGRGYNLFLTPAEAVFTFKDSIAQKTRVLGMKLANVSSEPNIMGVSELLGKTNYLIGNDQSAWKTNIPTFAKVKYQGVYPGIDLLFYGNQQLLEYDFVVSPGADPKLIKLGFDGADSRMVNTNGDLVLGHGRQEIQFLKPYVYQEDEGVRKTISGDYALENDRLIGFKIGPYDVTKPLFIDPILVYSTYLGGSGSDGTGDIAVDSSGNSYVIGTTNSVNFPTTSGIFQNTLAGANDAFVTKLNPTGTAIIYSTYIGGGNNDIADRIAIDNSGNAYIVGHTDSTNYPTFNALQPSYGGAALDDFLTKLNSSGTGLVFSTYIGGNGNDGDANLILDNTGNIYVSGNTTSTNLPTTPGVVQSAYGGGSEDIYIAKLNPSGSSFIYLTYLGGGDIDQSINIAVDGSGDVYVTGTSFSSNFPVTSGAF